jgi:uncharacterized protein involved in cysteine biosynthesis
MIKLIFSALADTFSGPLRGMLLRSVAMAVVALGVVGFALFQGLAWLAGEGGDFIIARYGFATAVGYARTVVDVLAGFGVFAAVLFLVPPVTALIAGLSLDEVAQRTETARFVGLTPGTPPPTGVAVWESSKFFFVVLLVNLIALPFALFFGLGAIAAFLANAYLIGREYFEMAAMRRRPPAEAKALRKRHAFTVFATGLPVAALLSVPVLNLIAPMFGTVLMVHLVQRLDQQESAALFAGPRS